MKWEEAAAEIAEQSVFSELLYNLSNQGSKNSSYTISNPYNWQCCFSSNIVSNMRHPTDSPAI